MAWDQVKSYFFIWSATYFPPYWGKNLKTYQLIRMNNPFVNSLLWNWTLWLRRNVLFSTSLRRSPIPCQPFTYINYTNTWKGNWEQTYNKKWLFHLEYPTNCEVSYWISVAISVQFIQGLDVTVWHMMVFLMTKYIDSKYVDMSLIMNTCKRWMFLRSTKAFQEIHRIKWP